MTLVFLLHTINHTNDAKYLLYVLLPGAEWANSKSKGALLSIQEKIEGLVMWVKSHRSENAETFWGRVEAMYIIPHAAT